MKAAVILMMLFPFINLPKVNWVIDFGSAAEQTTDWVMISDNVMGGVTKSTLQYKENSMILSGDISLDNYGGFASVKTRFGKFDLSAYKGVKIRFKSTNQKFAFTLEETKNWTMPNFKGSFAPAKENTWTEATIYFSDFEEYQIGEPTGREMKKSVQGNVVRMGIITTEKKEGPFSLEVDYIEFVK